jgi:D-alanine-D-alanine ligase
LFGRSNARRPTDHVSVELGLLPRRQFMGEDLLRVALLYNSPVLPPDHPDSCSEAGVLESVHAIGESLRLVGHRVHEVACGSSVAAVISALSGSRPDVVVNLCESFAGNSAYEPHVASLLEMLQLPYTGSPPDCLALARDKPRTKRLLASGGIPTPEFIELPRGAHIPERSTRELLAAAPLVLKPAREDASLGITVDSVTTDWSQLSLQVAAVHERYGDALVERYIDGREFNVGIIELPEFTVLPLAEIDFERSTEAKWPILSYAAKWSPDSAEFAATPVRCPAAIDKDLERRIKDAAVRSYQIAGCRDYARIDLRVDRVGQPQVLEVNANPDLNPIAGLARMLRAAGISYDEFVGNLIRQAKSRGQTAKSGHQTSHAGAKAPKTEGVQIRPFSPHDLSALIEITRSCGVFRRDEIEIAAELLSEAARDGEKSHYHVLAAEREGDAVGWACHGRVPLTDATFDLYWIAVAPIVQSRGIGRTLLNEVESIVQSSGGRWLLAETSSTSAYKPTRDFYRRCGYHVLSEIADFYRTGDGKITFGKRLE